MKRLFLSGLVINVLVMAINLLTGILSARYLGPEGRGILAVAVRWSGMFAMLFTIGLPGAVIYLGKQFPERQRELFGVYLLLGTAIGLTGLLIGHFMLPFVLASQPAEVVFLAKIAMIGVPFGVLADGFIGTLQTLNKFRGVMAIRLLNPLGTMVIILILILLNQYTVGVFIAANLIWSIIIFLLPVVRVWSSIRPRLQNVWITGKELFVTGTKIYAGSLVSTFGISLDQLVMSIFLTAYTLGIYAVSSSIGSILPSVVIGAISLYLFPKLMDLSKEARGRTVEQLHGTLFYATAGLSLLGIVLLPFLLPLLYGGEYTSAVLMGQILLLSAPIQVVFVVLNNYISTEGKFVVVTISEILGLAVGLITMLSLLHTLDGLSAALGVTIAAYVKWGYAAYHCTRMGLSIRQLLRFDPEPVTKALKAVSKKRSLQSP